MEYLSSKYQNMDTKRVRCFAWGSKQETKGFLKKWHMETTQIQFEGLTVWAPKDIHGFLTYSFGKDYMTLPPKEKRVPRHTVTYLGFAEKSK